MSSEKKPNHICKYSKCDLGTDENGNKCRKQYWACDKCDKLYSWRAVACCPEHFAAYQEEVLASRTKNMSLAEKREIWEPDRPR